MPESLDGYKFEPSQTSRGTIRFIGTPTSGEGIPVNVTENQLLNAHNHSTLEKPAYNLGYEDAGGTVPADQPESTVPKEGEVEESTKVQPGTEDDPLRQEIAQLRAQIGNVVKQVGALNTRIDQLLTQAETRDKQIMQLLQLLAANQGIELPQPGVPAEETPKESKPKPATDPEPTADAKPASEKAVSDEDEYELVGIDGEALDALLKRLSEIRAALADNPPPDEKEELLTEFNRVLSQLGEVSAPSETSAGSGAESVEVSQEELNRPNELRRRRRFQRVRDLVTRFRPRRRVIYEEEERIAGPYEERRTFLAGVAAGALALGAGVGIGWLLTRGYSADVIKIFCQGHHGGIGPDHIPHGGGIGPDHIPHGGSSHVNLHGIGPDTIHAKNPTQFQHGVLDLLERQGINAHGVTPDRIQHMNQWMDSHQIASGMRNGQGGLVQNLTDFPTRGHEFANAQASAEQGFRIGPALDQWVREAERIGIRFNRG